MFMVSSQNPSVQTLVANGKLALFMLILPWGYVAGPGVCGHWSRNYATW